MNKKIKNIILNIHCEIRANFQLYNNINNGGCGYFAKILSEYLISKNIKCKIVFFDNQKRKEKKKLLKEKKEKLSFDDKVCLSSNHILIQIGTTLIDAKGIYSIKNYYTNGTYTNEELNYVLKKGIWNSCYDRRKNKTIQKIIKTSCHKNIF